MVAVNRTGRKASRLVDLKFAHREAKLLNRSHGQMLDERVLGRLAAVTGCRDNQLLRRIFQAGFTPENLRALRYAPIAEVAWASGNVTQRERTLAVKPIFSTDLFTEPLAAEMFKTWLQKRPDSTLWSLWESYTLDTLSRRNQSEAAEFGQQLHQLATRIALASGGLLDQGDICAAEQLAINRIARVYNIEQPA